MSKLAEALSYGGEVCEEKQERLETLSRSFEDEYEKVADIERRLKETAQETYHPRILSRQNVGLFLFLSDYKK
ncbi:hypothetical protein MAR_ORF309 [Marseillevirus marseillevirus]|uniref:Uncharacterized protein n=1 Tax=Marseillevirus marseillevirus TaxID=694581 RepID=D2XAV4_GBMV|nr:hypothetical protein MAR_ORF309 [Marseillevirus marseillevirus]ADB04081.1 hypothetical protein MAR_ORF309 [Marseillevirus marseillevirus]